MWKTSQLGDKSQILAFLETDRLYAAYAIGDLEPALFAQSTWVGASAADRLQALVLFFRGLKIPALFLIGDTAGLRSILENALCPERAYLTCRPEHLVMTRDFYKWDEIIPMWRMVLRPADFKPVQVDCLRLGREHVDQLTALFAPGSGIGYHPAQVESGVFYGLFVEDQLVAAAGTHLVSPTYGVAAVGNVYTHPDCRGRGYGTATTSAVVTELLRLGLRDIVLNVSQSNAVAVRIYERLGFERYCDFLEGRAHARGGVR